MKCFIDVFVFQLEAVSKLTIYIFLAETHFGENRKIYLYLYGRRKKKFVGAAKLIKISNFIKRQNFMALNSAAVKPMKYHLECIERGKTYEAVPHSRPMHELHQKTL